MRVAVSPTRAEYQAAERAVVTRLQRTAPGVAIARWGGAAGGLLIALALFALMKAEYPPGVRTNLSVIATIGLLILGAVVWAISVSVSKWRITRSLYAEGSKLLAPYTIELTPQALVIESAGSHAQVAWSHIEDVAVTPQQTLVFTAVTHALPVPARCFPSNDEYNAFIAHIRSYTRREA